MKILQSCKLKKEITWTGTLYACVYQAHTSGAHYFVHDRVASDPSCAVCNGNL